MEQPSEPAISSEPSPYLPPPAQVSPSSPPLITQEYRGNQYDLYSLIAGALGGTTLITCLSFGYAGYCLPLVPLILGIIALRKAPAATDPQRTRNMALIGIAGGGIGTILLLCMLAFLLIYFVFIFAVMGFGLSTVPRR